jgi:GNAT acetyltransferase-like protein
MDKFLDQNYRQVWDFGVACADRVGAVSEHIAFQQSERVIGLADVRLKSLPLIGGVAYITGAPMVRIWGDERLHLDYLRTCLRLCVDEYVRRRRLVLRIMLPIGDETWCARQHSAMQEAGFALTDKAKPYRTMMLDLTADEDAIRGSLAQKWRNCLNAASRKNLRVTTGDGPEFFERFGSLFEDLTMRKRFETDLSPAFYSSVQSGLESGEKFLVTLVEAEGELAAGHVGHIAGDTGVYLLGASNDLGRKAKASYLAQWAFVKAAKAAGCTTYDLGGIDPDGNAGVYHFKKGMGGTDRLAVGPYELKPRGVRGSLLSLGEQAYRVAKRRSIRPLTKQTAQ